VFMAEVTWGGAETGLGPRGGIRAKMIEGQRNREREGVA